MLKVEKFETYGWEAAVRGMRNPMNSWEKSDSEMLWTHEPSYMELGRPDLGMSFVLGAKDLDLMKRLRHGGSDDRKFMRQIFVSCDITAPLYWWKEMDQYKVSTVTNSCSTMHKIASKEFETSDFSHEHLTELDMSFLRTVIDHLNRSRELYNETKDKSWWWSMIQLLPSSYNQKRTWTANYEVLANIYQARHNHKLDEWHQFCDGICGLPYSKELILGEKDER